MKKLCNLYIFVILTYEQLSTLCSTETLRELYFVSFGLCRRQHLQLLHQCITPKESAKNK